MGVSNRVGSLISYLVRKVNGTIVSRTTASRVTNLNSQIDENKSMITALDKMIQ